MVISKGKNLWEYSNTFNYALYKVSKSSVSKYLTNNYLLMPNFFQFITIKIQLFADRQFGIIV